MITTACRLLTVIALVLFLAPAAKAAEYGGIRELYVYPLVEYFTWEEFLDSAPKNVKEDGVLYGIGAVIDITALRSDKGVLGIKGKTELFGGQIDYNGLSQSTISSDPTRIRNNRPADSNVNYFGIKQEVDLTLSAKINQYTFGPIAGVGYRWWLRDIKDTTSIDRNGAPFPVTGYTEEWMSVYSVIGGQAAYRYSDHVNIFAELGAKYPFYNTNTVSFSGTDSVIKPGSQWSIFAETGVRFNKIRTAFFYDGFRTSKSPVVNGLLQPKSESDIFGINIGWCFW